MNLAVPEDHRVKIKETKKRNKCLDLAREQKMRLYMKITVITVEIGVLGTICKGWEIRLQTLEMEDEQKQFQVQHC